MQQQRKFALAVRGVGVQPGQQPVTAQRHHLFELLGQFTCHRDAPLSERGQGARRGVDPVYVYISIASLGIFYLSNRWTLSTIFRRDLASPCPAVVVPHGGPTSVTGAEWDGIAQYFVAKGYAWFAPNFRGSTTYGRDYERANHGVWGVADTHDCLAAHDHLAGLDWVDGSRIAIFGASYGSYMALASVVDRSKRPSRSFMRSTRPTASSSSYGWRRRPIARAGSTRRSRRT